MKALFIRLCWAFSVCAGLEGNAMAQQPLTWQEIRAKFAVANPNLRPGQIGNDESRAEEITAYLRPNPNLGVSVDGIQITPSQGVWKPLTGATESPNLR